MMMMNSEEYRCTVVGTVSYNRRKSVNTGTRQDISTAGDSDKEDDQVSDQTQTKLCGPLEVHIITSTHTKLCYIAFRFLSF